ncbi:uncharacterized protein LOC124155891 [Ischnura elegans]|uniref:uncharacterized protein LOC124155891 n=1 Tax=Ischnura elegans TaxID=197161 RepID=UPI001ED8A7CF|nr:uncharacterized protein LOC124155891 [Ischnura elegans]XP_046386018.1 uncharacterized protein LOC124155891 [Ischnura elegans]
MRLDPRGVSWAGSRCKRLGLEVAQWLLLVGKMVIPLTVAVYYAWIRKKHVVVRCLIAVGGLGSRLLSALPALLSFVASHLATPTASIKASALFYPATKIDPILRPLRNKLRSVSAPALSGLEDGKSGLLESAEPEKSVECMVLHDPGPGRTRADVIFIHGLHGSLYNTWRQGRWRCGKGGWEEKDGSILMRTLGTVATEEKGRVFKLYPRKHAAKQESGSEGETSTGETCAPTGNRPSSTFKSTFWKASFAPYARPCCEAGSDVTDGAGGGVNCGEEQHGSEDDRGAPAKSSNNNEEEEDCEGGLEMSTSEEEARRKEVLKRAFSDPCVTMNQEDSDDQYSECWPRDWLPKDCPGMRVIAINYSTDPFLWRPVWIRKKNRTTMVERSREMMEHLKRVGVGSRPIVWVGHSKGGLFVKQMLVDAWESQDEWMSGFYQQTKAIMFYSVPHRGSFLASLNLPFLLQQSVELQEVKNDSPQVLSLHQRFLQLVETVMSGVQVFSFTETDLTLMSVMFMRIVSVESADPNIGDYYGVSLDHREICKPRSRKCFLYQELTNLINSAV